MSDNLKDVWATSVAEFGFSVEYGNDTGPGDEGFWEWWDVVEGGETIAKCSDEVTAERIVMALIAYKQPKSEAENRLLRQR